MTHMDHLVVRKMGVKGPPIPLSKILNKSQGSPILLSKIQGALNPHFSHHQMIHMGHMNNEHPCMVISRVQFNSFVHDFVEQ